MGYIIARIIAIILLIWALDDHPYSYYTLLRFAVSAVSAYGTIFAIKLKKNDWAWLLGIIAILFNPFIPIHLDRNTWTLIDVGVAIILLVSLFLLKKPRTINGDHEKTSTNSL